MKDNNLRKNFIWNIIGSTFNSAISLFLLVFITRINGVKYAGIFSFSFAIACLFQVISYYSGRTYQVTEREKNITESDYIYTRFLCCMITLLIAFIFMMFKQYNMEKNIILLLLVLYKIIEAFEDVLYGIIQKKDELYKVGISLFLRGFLGAIIFIMTDIFTKNLVISLLVLVIYSIVLVIIYDLKVIVGYKFRLNKFNKLAIQKILKCGFNTFLVTLLIQYMINASKYAIDYHLSDKYQTVFGIIVMPATVIILFGQFIIHPFLTKLTKYLSKDNIKQFNSLIVKLSLVIFILGIISDIIAFLIGIPVLEIIYGLNLKKYVFDLVLIIGGATMFGVTFIISNALITLRDTFSQVVLLIISCIFTYFLSRYMVYTVGIHGAVYSYIISMGFQMSLFIIYYMFAVRRIKNGQSFNNNSVL